MEKDRKISAELSKLRKLFKGIPKNKQALCYGLLQNAAFMSVTLGDLQAEIVANGAVIPCQSGNGFDTIKDNPAQKAYTTMIARYSGIINQLLSLLPAEDDAKDILADFRNE